VNISSIVSFKSEYVFASLCFVFSSVCKTILGFVCDFDVEGEGEKAFILFVIEKN